MSYGYTLSVFLKIQSEVLMAWSKTRCKRHRKLLKWAIGVMQGSEDIEGFI